MQVTVDRDAFMDVASVVSRALASKTTQLIMQDILIVPDNRGLNLRATNGVLEIEGHVDCEVEGDKTAICVDGDMLVKLIAAFDPEPLTLSVKKMLSLSQNSRKHRLGIADASTFPDAQSTEETIDLSETQAQRLAEAINKVSFAVATDMSRPILTSVALFPEEGMVLAGDGQRLAWYDGLDFIVGPFTNLAPGSVQGAVTIMKAEENISISLDKWSTFRNDEFRVSCNSLAGVFPITPQIVSQQFIESTPKLCLTFDKAKLSQILSLATIYTNRTYSRGTGYHTTMVCEKESVKLSMDIQDADFEEIIGCDIDGSEAEGFTILFRADMLLDAINKVDHPKVEINLYSPTKPLIVKDHDHPNWSYIQVPMTD